MITICTGFGDNRTVNGVLIVVSGNVDFFCCHIALIIGSNNGVIADFGNGKFTVIIKFNILVVKFN